MTTLRAVSSRRNPLVDEYRRLGRRRQPGDPTILLDGLHMVRAARRAHLPIASAAFSTMSLQNRATADEAAALAAAGVDVIEVADSLSALLSPVRSPSGVVALAERPTATIDDLLSVLDALVVIALDVQDPGNLGAIVRACEAAGATGVIAAGASADPFSWKALRGSMGSALRLPVASGADGHDVVMACVRRGLQIAAAAAHGGRSVFDVDWVRPSALIVGNEGAGLPPDLAGRADVLVTIPMRAPVESLNVSVAAALVVYEAFRQRAGAPR